MAGTHLKKRRSLPFFFSMAGCAGRCIYCDQSRITGVGAAPEPADIRRKVGELDGPAEVAFFGGSFTCLPAAHVEACLHALDGAPPGSSLRLSTHPLCLSTETIRLLKALSAHTCSLSCVELGISSLDDRVLENCGRGYSGQQALAALDLLLAKGLPAGAQLMLGLPGQEEGSSLDDLRKIAALKGPRAMDIRIYPCLVLSGTPLEKLWIAGRYQPLSTETAAKRTGLLLREALALGFNVLRVGLAETMSLSGSVLSGPHHPSFGELAWGDCLARMLAETSPAGPWVEHSGRRSFFTGHGKWGMRRLSETTGIPLGEIESSLSFWPPRDLHRREGMR